MTFRDCDEPHCTEREGPVSLVIEPRARDLGGFSVGRVLPVAKQRTVGPFIFFDHMGPARLPPGVGIDVLPHPHIHLATLTYLFAGAISHKDSVGSDQEIRPGAVNWMNAGTGIVHSERSPHGERACESELHGIQLWVGLPSAHEDSEPSFQHMESSLNVALLFTFPQHRKFCKCPRSWSYDWSTC